MVSKGLNLVWTASAKKQLREIIGHIKKDSPQNAIKVREKILHSTSSIPGQPLKHNPDKFKLDNDGSFRAYEIYRYRIVYFVSENTIVILRISHTSREPKEY